MGAGTMDDLSELKDIKNELTRFMMSYKFGIDEMMTKVNVLKDEFIYLHNYSPIEHVTSRLKSPESILKKAGRINCPLSVDDIRKNIWDIAGIRITCSFISDTYKISDMLTRQQDVNVIQFKNYIEHPKPNGYRSLHLIVEVPVFMSDRVAPVYVEVQLRTIAMDFWASLEHKIYYKYDREVPAYLVDELRDAATAANRLDTKMEHLHDEIAKLNDELEREETSADLSGLLALPLPDVLLKSLVLRSRGDQ